MKQKDEWYWLDCDFVSGACYSYENAIQHIEVSKLLASQKKYGFAVSHLILGAEELIKSIILVRLNTERYFIETREKDELFRNHSFKHINIKEFLQSLCKSHVEDYAENWFDNLLVTDPKNKYQQTGYFLSKRLNLGAINDDEIEQLEKLIKNANDIKNKGLYVDYRDDWKTPDEINENTYLQYAALIEKLRIFIAPVFSLPLGANELTDFIYGY